MKLYKYYKQKTYVYLRKKKNKNEEIIHLKSSMRRSTLRSKNPEHHYASEEDIKKAYKSLKKIEKDLDNLHKWTNYHYMKTVEITKEMNNRGMWQLS